METLELKLDENNELYFTVHVESTSSSGAVKVRMITESDVDGIQHSFLGKINSNGDVVVNVPSLKNKFAISENKEYTAKLEVLIENRCFTPLEFNLKFKDSIKVEAKISNTTQVVQESKNANAKVTAVVRKNPTATGIPENIMSEVAKSVSRK